MLTFIGALVTLLLVGPPVLIMVVGLLFLAATILPGKERRVRETFRCPLTREFVAADFLVPEGTAHPSEVVWCTAFQNPEQITCAKPCREFADARWGLSRGMFPRWALTSGGTVTWRNPGSLKAGCGRDHDEQA